jgi:hypothetical protein
MRKRNFLIGTVCLTLLITSHWFAFSLGKKRGDEAFRAFGRQLVVEAEFRQLRAHVAILRAMVKHLDRFSTGEIMGERLKGQNALTGGERITLPYLKKTGDEIRAQEVQALVHEGRELWSKLPQEKKAR